MPTRHDSNPADLNLPTFSIPEFYEQIQHTGLVRRVLEIARDEDLGASNTLGDITSRATVDEAALGEAHITARVGGTIAGLAAIPDILDLFAPKCRFLSAKGIHDGCIVRRGTALGTLQGPLRQLLAAERTLLNLLSRLSGIATLTAEYLAAMHKGDLPESPAAAAKPRKSGGQPVALPTKLFDTRKTTPGLRVLEKYAVRCGGGHSHRLGLFDAVLIKDNHLASVPLDKLAAHVDNAARTARSLALKNKIQLQFIEVEVDSLDQLRALLDPPGGTPKPQIDIILVDNMNTTQLAQAVELRNTHAKHVLLEASGGISKKTIRSIALTGVDRISVGALTHSAVALDIGLDIPATKAALAHSS